MVCRGVDGKLGDAIGDEGELGGDPGGDEGDAGHRRTGGIDEVGKEGARDFEPVGEGAGDPPDHEAVGESVEEADQAEAKYAGEETALAVSRGATPAQEEGEQAASAFQNGGKSPEKEGEYEGPEVPRAGKGGKSVVGEPIGDEGEGSAAAEEDHPAEASHAES